MDQPQSRHVFSSFFPFASMEKKTFLNSESYSAFHTWHEKAASVQPNKTLPNTNTRKTGEPFVSGRRTYCRRLLHQLYQPTIKASERFGTTTTTASLRLNDLENEAAEKKNPPQTQLVTVRLLIESSTPVILIAGVLEYLRPCLSLSKKWSWQHLPPRPRQLPARLVSDHCLRFSLRNLDAVA